jgi:hypothetical protein
MARFVVNQAGTLVPDDGVEYVVVDTHYPNSASGSPTVEGVAKTPSSHFAAAIAAALNTADTDFSAF